MAREVAKEPKEKALLHQHDRPHHRLFQQRLGPGRAEAAVGAIRRRGEHRLHLPNKHGRDRRDGFSLSEPGNQDVGLEAAGILEERFGIPHLYSLPFGIRGTVEWLEDVGERLDLDLGRGVLASELEGTDFRSWSSPPLSEIRSPEGDGILSLRLCPGIGQVDGGGVGDEIAPGGPAEVPEDPRFEEKFKRWGTPDILIGPDTAILEEEIARIDPQVIFGNSYDLYLAKDVPIKIHAAFPAFDHLYRFNGTPLSVFGACLPHPDLPQPTQPESRGVSKMKKIAIYGKGGSESPPPPPTFLQALGELGYKVMQIGCDPKADSTSMLMNGRPVPTILDTLRESGGGVPRRYGLSRLWRRALCRMRRTNSWGRVRRTRHNCLFREARISKRLRDLSAPGRLL